MKPKSLNQLSGYNHYESLTAPRVKISLIAVTAFFLVHIPLSIFFKANPTLSTIHAIGTLIFGFFALSRQNNSHLVIYTVFYIVGCEALWRMTSANVFWEFAKYASSLLFVCAILKQGKFASANKLPFIYFILLIPSIFVLPELEKRLISFNLSGPLALSISCIYFSTVKLQKGHFIRLTIALLGPIIGIAFLATSGTLQHEYIEFRQSTSVTSAGFGANQMSTTLGLGAYFAILSAIFMREHRKFLFLMIFIGLWLTVQCVLTYSRGGFWTEIGALLVASIYLIREKRLRRNMVVMGIILFVCSKLIIVPWIDEFTRGSVFKRFQSFSTTRRADIAKDDLIIFFENPILGVGPGKSGYWHRQMSSGAHGAHTEFSRLISEHGVFGLIAFFLLISIVLKRYKSCRNPHEKAISISLFAWAVLNMLHAAMRLSSSSIIFGLGLASIDSYEDNHHHVSEKLKNADDE